MRTLALVMLAGCADVFSLQPVADQPDATIEPNLLLRFPMDDLVSGKTREVTRHDDAACAQAACPTTAEGKLAGGLHFDGLDDIMHVPIKADQKTETGFTLSAWVFQDKPLFADDWGCVFSKRLGTAANNSWQLCVVEDSVTRSLAFYSSALVAAGAGSTLSAPAFTMSAWHHVAIVWNRTMKLIYVDGSVVATSSADITFDDGEIVLGSDVDNGQVVTTFPGTIDEVRLYDRALDPIEIVMLAQ